MSPFFPQFCEKPVDKSVEAQKLLFPFYHLYKLPNI